MGHEVIGASEAQRLQAKSVTAAETVVTVEEYCRMVHDQVGLEMPFELYLESCYELWKETLEATESSDVSFEDWKKLPAT